jgi:hypothetical protein
VCVFNLRTLLTSAVSVPRFVPRRVGISIYLE